jgi:apolipoprotein N-acyltransferase
VPGKRNAAHYNEARIYQPHAPVLSYDKEHMLPPFESPLTPGTALVTLPRRQEMWGVAICKDMDFAGPANRYGRQNVGLMLAPAWDFNLDRGWHGHIAVMRAVEGGFSLVRAAKDGYLTVSDNRGRVLAETRSDAAKPFATLLASVPAVHSATVYLLLGDWFAWVACVLLALAVFRLCWVVMGARVPPESVAIPATR